MLGQEKYSACIFTFWMRVDKGDIHLFARMRLKPYLHTCKPVSRVSVVGILDHLMLRECL